MIYMNGEDYLLFLNDISKDKPNNINESDSGKCPFCDRKNLTNIIEEEGPFLLLENKYHTLKDTYQLVLIETYKCESNISEYSIEYLERLMNFGIRNWIKLERRKEFKSVIYYKNHGPRSGGSLLHPHMQIVGLNNIDYKLKLKDEYFKGIDIYNSERCLVNLSDRPINGFSEFNIIIGDKTEYINDLCINLKKITHYILNDYFQKCDSFNLYFYHWKEKIICKITPRFTTSPLLLGYSIKQISNCAEDIALKLKMLYY